MGRASRYSRRRGVGGVVRVASSEWRRARTIPPSRCHRVIFILSARSAAPPLQQCLKAFVTSRRHHSPLLLFFYYYDYFNATSVRQGTRGEVE